MTYEAQGIYRGEVHDRDRPRRTTVDVRTTLGYIEGDDDEEETEDFPDP